MSHTEEVVRNNDDNGTFVIDKYVNNKLHRSDYYIDHVILKSNICYDNGKLKTILVYDPAYHELVLTKSCYSKDSELTSRFKYDNSNSISKMLQSHYEFEVDGRYYYGSKYIDPYESNIIHEFIHNAFGMKCHNIYKHGQLISQTWQEYYNDTNRPENANNYRLPNDDLI